MRTKVAIGILALGAAVALCFVLFGASDEDKIRATVTRLAATVEVKDDGSNVLLRAARVRDELERLLTNDVHVSVSELSRTTQGLQGVADVGAQAQLGFSRASVSLSSIEIKMNDTKTSAQVGAQATLRGKTFDGETRRDERAVDFLLRKEDGAWRVSSVTVWPPKEARSSAGGHSWTPKISRTRA